jgi:hypothetical protein
MEFKVMTAATTTKIAQITLLCTGLFIANSVWSKDCVDDPGAANNTKTSASRTELYPVKIEMKRGPLSAVEQHELFHDVTLNKPDDLGDYREDYLAIYPN